MILLAAFVLAIARQSDTPGAGSLRAAHVFAFVVVLYGADALALGFRVWRLLRPFPREKLCVSDSLRVMASGAVGYSLTRVAMASAYLVGLGVAGMACLGGHLPLVGAHPSLIGLAFVGAASAAADIYLSLAVRRLRRLGAGPPPPGFWKPSAAVLRLLVALRWAFWPFFLWAVTPSG